MRGVEEDRVERVGIDSALCPGFKLPAVGAVQSFLGGVWNLAKAAQENSRKNRRPAVSLASSLASGLALCPPSGLTSFCSLGLVAYFMPTRPALSAG